MSPFTLKAQTLLAALLLAVPSVQAQYYYPRRRYGLASGAIAAIAIVSIVVPFLLILALLFTIRRRRRYQVQSGPGVYVSAPPPPYAPPSRNYPQPRAPGFFGRVLGSGQPVQGTQDQKEAAGATGNQGYGYANATPGVAVPPRTAEGQSGFSGGHRPSY